MKRALVMVALLALTSSAHAENRKAWKITFASSVAVGVGAVMLQVHATHLQDDARTQLCDGGAYHSMPGCESAPVTLTQSQVEELNAQGDRARLEGRIGLATTGVAVVVAGVALYEGFIKPDSRVVIAPDVGKDRAGASLQIRW